MIGTFPEVLDSSLLATLKACPRKFELSYLEQWKAKEESVHLVAGKAFATGLEVARTSHYVEGDDPETAVAKGLEALLESYGSFDCPADSAKSAERTAGALEFYFDQYPLNDDSPPIILPSGKHGIEFSFSHPLPLSHPDTGNPLLYCGRMDAVLQYAGGIFICDEKTTTSLGPTWSRQWDLRSQFSGYAWGCAQAGIHVDGAIVRGVAILKTKYDHQQAISYRPEWQVDRWFDEMLEWVERAIESYKRKKFLHNLDNSCADFGGCGFRQVCATQRSEQHNWLETYFERRHWDPVSRVETKL